MRKPTFYFRTVIVMAFAAALSLAGGVSLGAVLIGDYLGKTRGEIAINLETQGYEVEDFGKEDGLIVVEATFDGVSYEIHVNPETGEVVSFEEDD